MYDRGGEGKLGKCRLWRVVFIICFFLKLYYKNLLLLELKVMDELIDMYYL